MSWLKQPQNGQRVSNTEPNCMISCSIHRREPIFDAILRKGSPPRPHPAAQEAGARTRRTTSGSRGVFFPHFRQETKLSLSSSGPKEVF